MDNDYVMGMIKWIDSLLDTIDNPLATHLARLQIQTPMVLRVFQQMSSFHFHFSLSLYAALQKIVFGTYYLR